MSKRRLTIYASRIGLRNRLEMNIVKTVEIVMLSEFSKVVGTRKILFDF